MEGVIKSVMVQAALFGGIHFLQGLVAFSLQTAVLNIANGFISGVWWGAMRYHWRSLWPVILLHGLSNLVVQVNGLTTPTIEPAVLAYGRAALLELPLMVWGMWLLWRGTVQGE